MSKESNFSLLLSLSVINYLCLSSEHAEIIYVTVKERTCCLSKRQNERFLTTYAWEELLYWITYDVDTSMTKQKLATETSEDGADSVEYLLVMLAKGEVKKTAPNETTVSKFQLNISTKYFDLLRTIS